MSPWICETCGVQYPAAPAPPAACPICEDPRQYVGPNGQQWTTPSQLRSSRRNTLTELAPGLWNIHTTPAYGISQHAFLLQTGEGNLLWDCVTLLDGETRSAIEALGGIQAIAVSHPHYYSAMADWSDTFQAPLWIHANDEAWIPCRPQRLQLWSGAKQELFGGITLVLSGGHFDGFQVAHWNRNGGMLFAGDQPQVCLDRRWVSFLWSYPNMIPFNAAQVEAIVATLRPYEFDRIYGAFGRHILSGAKECVERSAARYLRAIA